MMTDDYLKSRIFSTQLESYTNKVVKVAGRVYNKRVQKTLVFLVVMDLMGKMQVVFNQSLLDKHTHDTVLSIKLGDLVVISGVVKPGMSPIFPFEITNSQILNIYHTELMPCNYTDVSNVLPIETTLLYNAISIRHPCAIQIHKVIACVVQSIRHFLYDKVHAIETFLPIIVNSGGESGANMFPVCYFDSEQAYLTQSGQVFKQVVAGALERVFAISPCFRAEQSKTRNHLTEFHQVEFETLAYDSVVLDVVLDILEGLLYHVVDALKKEYKSVSDQYKWYSLLRTINTSKQIPRITFLEAVGLYLRLTHNDEDDPKDIVDLDRNMEKIIGDKIMEETGSPFVFVTHFPTQSRAFYSYQSTQDNVYTETFDLLFLGLEIASGGQRMHIYQDVLEALKNNNLSVSQYKIYLDAFKYGMPPHGGFGLGLSRFLQQLLQVDNIRDIVMFPSDCYRIAGSKISTDE